MNNNSYVIDILKDKKRLNEIYLLRVEAWESSQSSNIINHNKYPEGFKDELDEDSIHLIARDCETEKIMSACRVTFFNGMERYPYIGLKEVENLASSNFALIGRGVRIKSFSFNHLQYDFVSFGLNLCKENGINWVMGHAYNENKYMQNLMINLGFKFLCNVENENYLDAGIAYAGKLFAIDLSE